MDSLQVVVNRDDDLETPLELHFNLWNSEENKIACLDIGFFCPVVEKPYEVLIIIPGKYSNDNISDLYDVIAESESARIIFNSYVEITKGMCSSFAHRCEKNNELKFVLYKLNKFKIEEKSKYSVITIQVPSKEELVKGEKPEFVKKIDECQQVYFRIRVNNLDKMFYSIWSDSISKPFESCYEQNLIVDFRINDLKLIDPQNLKEYAFDKTRFTKIHFLYICDFEQNVIQVSGSVRPRLLELEAWKNYLPNKISSETELKNVKDVMNSFDFSTSSLLIHTLIALWKLNQFYRKQSAAIHSMMAYHLSKKENDEGFSSASFLMKIQRTKTSRLHLLWYAIVVILLAIFANFIFSLIPVPWKMSEIIYYCLE
jgi:hypothetical protein